MIDTTGFAYPKPTKEKKPKHGMNKTGPRTEKRNAATAKLRRTVPNWYLCELRREGCTVEGTDWAHSRKSHNGIKWEECARSCRNCHTGPNGIEHLKPNEMERVVLEVIAQRGL